MPSSGAPPTMPGVTASRRMNEGMENFRTQAARTRDLTGMRKGGLVKAKKGKARGKARK